MIIIRDVLRKVLINLLSCSRERKIINGDRLKMMFISSLSLTVVADAVLIAAPVLIDQTQTSKNPCSWGSPCFVVGQWFVGTLVKMQSARTS
jgi:hypothetical protein